MELEKLYKKTSVGKTQVWWMEVEEDKYRAHSGQLNGKIVVSEWTVAEPKNTGKKNATTGKEQALFEVKSTYKDKKKKGYVESLEDLKNGTFDMFQVMLAKDFKDPPRRRDFEKHLSLGKKIYSQRKFDGARCWVSLDKRLMSRWSNEIVSVPHIFEYLKPIFEEYPDIKLDGELYNHELKDDFNMIMSLVKKLDPTQKDLEMSRDMIQYHIYDCFIPDKSDAPYSERLAFITKIIGKLNNPSIVLAETTEINSLKQLNSLYNDYLDNEFEGQMIRLDDIPYKQGARSPSLLKRKETIDEEFEVFDVTEGIGNRAGMAGRCFCKLPDGRTFKANIKGDREFLREVLNNKEKYIGGKATVVFGNYTPAGIPRFGRIKAFWPKGRDL